MPFTMSEGFQHPEGTFKARIIDWVETEGKFGDQIKWVFSTGQIRPNGEEATLNYYTGMRFSQAGTPAAKETKLTQLVRALGMVVPQDAEEAELFDQAKCENIDCMIDVQMAEGSQYANIVRVMALPKSTGQHVTRATRQSAEVAVQAVATTDIDPFA